jgi:hypothetical protein
MKTLPGVAGVPAEGDIAISKTSWRARPWVAAAYHEAARDNKKPGHEG